MEERLASMDASPHPHLGVPEVAVPDSLEVEAPPRCALQQGSVRREVVVLVAGPE